MSLGSSRKFGGVASCETRARRRQSGFTLVELLVGGAMALVVVAMTSTALVASLRADRTMLVESRLMQDLRTAADMVSRDLRRAGYWGAAASGVRGSESPASNNPYAGMVPVAGAASQVEFRYSRDEVEDGIADSSEQFGYRLRAGSLEFQLGSGNWQALTDANTLVLDTFAVTPLVLDIDLSALCDTPCPVVGANCPPHQQILSFDLQLAGHAAANPSVRRSMHSQVRVRNDAIVGACAS